MNDSSSASPLKFWSEWMAQFESENCMINLIVDPFFVHDWKKATNIKILLRMVEAIVLN